MVQAAGWLKTRFQLLSRRWCVCVEQCIAQDMLEVHRQLKAAATAVGSRCSPLRSVSKRPSCCCITFTCSSPLHPNQHVSTDRAIGASTACAEHLMQLHSHSRSTVTQPGLVLAAYSVQNLSGLPCFPASHLFLARSHTHAHARRVVTSGVV